MTKNELIAAVAERTHMSKIAAASAVEATFDAITATLKNGGEVKIMGFATAVTRAPALRSASRLQSGCASPPARG
jgi:DNA-binding protein HU-beta